MSLPDGLRSRPHPSFVLAPVNKMACKLTAHPRNAKYQVALENEELGLDISFHTADKVEFRLGRADDVDIYLPETGTGGDLRPYHCAFFFNIEAWAVFFLDYSGTGNVEPYAKEERDLAIPFSADYNSVLVGIGINDHVAIGKNKLYKFELRWRADGLSAWSPPNQRLVGPRKGRYKRYLQGVEVGGGSFGKVFRGLDVFTGKLLAIKKFHNFHGRNFEFAERERKNLIKINNTRVVEHDHIVEIVGAAGSRPEVKHERWGEIYMPLKNGSVGSLVENFPVSLERLADRVLKHMLFALACLAKNNIIHRDLKPENILWELDSTGDYHFRLADFGMSKEEDDGDTFAGTAAFMAPEVWYHRKQTTKVDIWSLLATYVWIQDIGDYRTNPPSHTNAAKYHQLLTELADNTADLLNLRSMASVDARDRPSAGELLLGIFGHPPDIDTGGDATTMGPLMEGFTAMSVSPQGSARQRALSTTAYSDSIDYTVSDGSSQYTAESPRTVPGMRRGSGQQQPLGDGFLDSAYGPSSWRWDRPTGEHTEATDYSGSGTEVGDQPTQRPRRLPKEESEPPTTTESE